RTATPSTPAGTSEAARRARRPRNHVARGDDLGVSWDVRSRSATAHRQPGEDRRRHAMAAQKAAAKKAAADDGPQKKLIASNKRARHDYYIDDTWEAGIVLTGTEVKSLRDRGASLIDGYCYVDGGEVWMDNAHIAPYVQGTWTNHAARRKRKLLMHKQEIVKLASKSREKGYTIVP